MYNYSYAKNKASLKKCEKAYKYITIFYLAAGFTFIASHLFVGFLALFTPQDDEMMYFINGVILKIPFLAFGFLGCYQKKNLYAVLAFIVIGLNSVIYLTVINEILTTVSAVAAALTCIANRKYRELEQCDGFPEFNERFSKQEDAKKENRDVYQEQLEAIISRTAENRGKMDEL